MARLFLTGVQASLLATPQTAFGLQSIAKPGETASESKPIRRVQTGCLRSSPGRNLTKLQLLFSQPFLFCSLTIDGKNDTQNEG